ncbi:MAG TPA: hypothetical protein VNL18_15185 [Gemmatimonadales bacterium]|nr:hypothetical protein [Gemmatimonadales bacterium]
MNAALIGAVVSLVAWIILAFVIPWPSGWAHVPLAVGVVLLVKAIVGPDRPRQGG